MIKIIFFLVSALLFISPDKVYANIVFPAVCHQFMVAIIVGWFWSVVLALSILLTEMIFVRILLSLNFFLCFILVLFINFITSLVGAFGLSIFTDLLIPTSSLAKILTYGNMKLGTYLGMAPGYILTVLLEGLLLFPLALLNKKKIGFAKVMKTSFIMNFYSYLIILFGVFIADIVTKGQAFKTF